MPTVVGVKFGEYGRVHVLDAAGAQLRPGDRVLVQRNGDAQLGTVVTEPRKRPPYECPQQMEQVTRVATEDDENQADAMQRRRKKALRVCAQKIEQLDMPMRLVDAVCSFDGKRITFYFSAEDRLDFRKLVKELTAVFRTRIQMEQIGVRDEAGRLGGCGNCGRTLCCSTWLPQFYPVSIRMAKEQWLSLNPAKISGVCGRLLCCLRYEHDTYCELNCRAPKPGSRVQVAGVTGRVVDLNVIAQRVTVELETGVRELFPLDEVEFGTPAAKPKKGSEKPPDPPKAPEPPKEKPTATDAAREAALEAGPEPDPDQPRKRRRRRRKKPGAQQQDAKSTQPEAATPKGAGQQSDSGRGRGKSGRRRRPSGKNAPAQAKGPRSQGQQSQGKPEQSSNRQEKGTSKQRRRQQRPRAERQARGEKQPSAETQSRAGDKPTGGGEQKAKQDGQRRGRRRRSRRRRPPPRASGGSSEQSS